MNRYTACFKDAADDVAATRQFPGQIIPGLWDIDRQEQWPVVIGVIVANSLQRVALRRELEFDGLIERFMALTAGEDFLIKGDPAIMARQRLEFAAEKNREATESAHDRLVRLAGEAADALNARYQRDPVMNVESGRLAGDLRRALADSRAAEEEA